MFSYLKTYYFFKNDLKLYLSYVVINVDLVCKLP